THELVGARYRLRAQRYGVHVSGQSPEIPSLRDKAACWNNNCASRSEPPLLSFPCLRRSAMKTRHLSYLALGFLLGIGSTSIALAQDDGGKWDRGKRREEQRQNNQQDNDRRRSDEAQQRRQGDEQRRNNERQAQDQQRRQEDQRQAERQRQDQQRAEQQRQSEQR